MLQELTKSEFWLKMLKLNRIKLYKTINDETYSSQQETEINRLNLRLEYKDIDEKNKMIERMRTYISKSTTARFRMM